MSTPHPNTAIVFPPASSVPRCAAVSMPRAMPLITPTPSPARSPASFSATAVPYGVGFRVPTTATMIADSSPTSPRQNSTVGGSRIPRSFSG